jgi:hypothetical protein
MTHEHRKTYRGSFRIISSTARDVVGQRRARSSSTSRLWMASTRPLSAGLHRWEHAVVQRRALEPRVELPNHGQQSCLKL